MLIVLANSFPAFYGQLMTAHLDGDQTLMIGVTGTIYLTLGGMGGVVFGYLLDKTKKFKAVSIALICTVTTLFVLFTALVTQRNIAVDVVLVSLVGFTLMGLWGTGQNFGGELIYPEKETIYTSLLTAVSSIGTVGFMAAAQAVIEMPKNNGWLMSQAQLVGVMFSAMTFVTIPFYAMVKVTLNRTNHVDTDFQSAK